MSGGRVVLMKSSPLLLSPCRLQVLILPSAVGSWRLLANYYRYPMTVTRAILKPMFKRSLGYSASEVPREPWCEEESKMALLTLNSTREAA